MKYEQLIFRILVIFLLAYGVYLIHDIHNYGLTVYVQK